MDEQTRDHFDHIEWTGRTLPRRDLEAAKNRIDATRISLLGEREMRYWTDALRVTVYQLRHAIKATDSRDPAVIRDYLRRMALAAAAPTSAAA